VASAGNEGQNGNNNNGKMTEPFPGWKVSPKESVEEKYVELFAEAVSLCLKRGVSDPEGVVQETFLSLREKGVRVEDVRFNGTFYIRLRARCNSAYRREAARRRREAGSPIHAEGSDTLDCCSQEPSWVPQQQAACAEENPTVDDALRAEVREAVTTLGILTPEEKILFELRLEGYTVKEIAAQLGESPSATKSRLSRAYPKLRGFLAS
jgi:RNA polymerase sigma factor (sigma-70 family)